MLKLVGTDGKRFYSWDLTPGKHLIGRETGGGQSSCEFTIQDKTVSRKHAEIEANADGSKHYITDLGSHNGTLINGERLDACREVKEGDAIMFGQTEFRLAHSDEPQSRPSGPTKTRLSNLDPKNSVFLSINEALKPLPKKSSELPDLLPTLFDMAKMLVLPEPKEVMLQRSLELISKVIPAQRLAVLFVSEDQEEVYTVATILPGGRDPGEFTLSRTIVKEIITNKNAILIGDPMNDPRFAEQKSIIMSEMKSAVAAPLFDEGRVLGILYVDTTSPLQSYNDEHLRVLATFGNIIASRLLNYELLAERQEKQVIDAELRRASDIQKGLLVDTPPEFAGYTLRAFQEQSRAVGGDLYDMRVLPDGRLLFLVADVSGKGLGAALLMSNILASFRILYESDEFDLSRAVRQVSLQVNHFSRTGEFATLFIGLAEPNSKIIRYVNAGHNPPVVVRKDGGIEHLDPTGHMIGAFDFSEWKEERIELSDDDILFIFSDGVTEAQRAATTGSDEPDAEEDQYGDERMEKLLVESRGTNPAEVVDCLMHDILEFIGDAPRSDDITMMIIKRVIK